MQQLANLWNSQSRAAYFRARLMWNSIKVEEKSKTVTGYFGRTPEPFPEYDTVAPGHLGLTVPTYQGATNSGDLWRSRFVVAALPH